MAGSLLRRVLTPPLVFLAGAVVLFEETFWQWMHPVGALLARLPVFAWLERVVQRMPPRLVLALFLLPVALLIPLKLAALWLIGAGHVLAGVVLIVVAKVAGTALSARLYAIAQPRLMLVPLFVQLHARVQRLLAWAHAALAASPAWQAVRAAMARLRGGGLKRRFAAALRRFSRRAPAPGPGSGPAPH